MQLRERLLIEACSHFAGILQLGPIVDSEQKRTEIFSCTSGLRKSSDYELILLMYLYLQPQCGASLHIRRGEVLGDEALKSFALRGAVSGHPVRAEAARGHQELLWTEGTFENGTACRQRLAPKILSLSVQAVENRIDRLIPAALKELKARDTLLVE